MVKIISLHVKDGKVVDVAGIPVDIRLVVMDVDTMEETTLTSKDNIQ